MRRSLAWSFLLAAASNAETTVSHADESNAEASGSSHGSSVGNSICSSASVLSNVTGWCRYRSYAELREHLVTELHVEDPDEEVLHQCNEICLLPSAADYLRSCKTHAHHAAYTTWQEHMTAYPSLQWTVFFVVLSLMCGAFILKCFPTQIPYTVGILVVFALLGILGESLATDPSCPHHAWVHASQRDVYVHGHKLTITAVSREEWQLFIASGFHPDSFCVRGLPDGGVFNKKRTCGDGSLDPPGCVRFETLDQHFKLSQMQSEAIENEVPEYLSADELWTPSCNLLRDMLGLSDIDPHQLLVIFLPALLFESACFGIDMGIFKKQVIQITALAFPAMIVASAVTGLLVWASFDNWSFWVCWLIGIILSATDPVAVVALLRELGASKALGTLIEGESLLNDGSAYVLFVWVRNCIGYASDVRPPDWMTSDGVFERYGGCITCELFRVITQMLLFGIVFGWASGFVTISCCRFLYNQQFIEGPIVLAMSYLCFWMGELICGTSAVIAVVVMGLYCNVHKSDISADVFHFLHQFYGMCAHILNTVIFAIVGAKLGFLLIEGSLNMLWAVYSWQILVIYPIVLFARAFAIALFYPLLKRTGTGCTWQEAVIMWWGGLRGSVGLALAVQITHLQYDEKMWGTGCNKVTYGGDKQTISLDCRDQPATVIAMTVVVVAITVVVNGVTMAPLMKWLKVTELTEARKMMLNGSYAKLRQMTDQVVKDLQGEVTFFKDVKWDKIRHPDNGLPINVFHPDITDVPKAAWESVLNIERASYLRQFEHGELTREGFAVLENFMATLSARAKLMPADSLHNLYEEEFTKVVEQLKFDPSVVTFYDRVLAYHVAKAYIKAQLDVRHSMQLFKVTEAKTSVVLDSEEVERIQKARQYAIDAMTCVEKDHTEVLDQMGDLLKSVSDFVPSGEGRRASRSAHAKFARYKSRYAGKLVLLEQRRVVEHLVHEGLLDELDSAPMVQTINKKIEAIELAPLQEKIIKRIEAWTPDAVLHVFNVFWTWLRGLEPRSGRAGLRKMKPTNAVLLRQGGKASPAQVDTKSAC
mmetsp:Transcript_41660/g.103526  ORF Transcript_41660/g.103526 Transcript_41660/m.103526 type:complete len:1049 (+) Transcript_41660:99-3245(+)